MHQLPTRNIEGTYLAGESLTTKPKPIMFAENGCRVITGSDHGKVYVFKTEGGKPVDILPHASDDMVQSITVRRISHSSARLPNKYKDLLRCRVVDNCLCYII